MPENPRIEELRRRVQADPASIAFAALAEEYRRLGRHEEAVATCRAGLLRHPAYMSARVTLGRALLEMGDMHAAREQFETVLRSAPENLAAIRGLAQIHERLGHAAEMDPQLVQLMREHIAATPAPGAVEGPAPNAVEAPASSAVEGPGLSHVEGPPLDLPLAPPLGALEPAPSALEGPVLNAVDGPALSAVEGALANAPFIHTPDPAVSATLARLEHFLTLVQHARSA